MTDDQQAINTPVKETPEAPMPDAEQKTPDSTEENAAPKGETDLQEKKGLPDESSERTKREFEKLRTQLREEKSRRQYLETTFKTLENQKKEPEVPIYDPATGLLNEQALEDTRKRSMEAEKRALKAEERSMEVSRNVELNEVYTKHPEVDPRDKKTYNEDLDNLASGLLYHSSVSPDRYGKQLTPLEAVEKAKQLLFGSKKDVEKAKEEGAKEAIEGLTPKEQAALEATGSPSRRSETIDTGELQRRTRKGDMDAIMERLNRLK